MHDTRTPMTPRLIDSLYLEAMVLADEARAYFDKNGRDERMALSPKARVGFSCESLKVTTRLMHVITWLLARKAVETGEAVRGRVQMPGRELGEAIESDPEVLKELPESALSLIRSSQELYDRVRRLSESERGDGATQPSPARNLLNRLESSF